MYHRFNERVGEQDRCLSLTNISFDVGVSEIFLPLTYGAALVLFENAQVLDVEKLAQTIVGEKITYTYIPPTILKQVCELLKEHKAELALNKLLVGVEPIKDYVLEEYLSLNESMQVINGYGPTEATICASMYNYGDKEPCGRNVPIGSPMLNTQIYILDSSGKPAPVGAAGELCISGDNLARGYLYRPELTAEKFTVNSFIPGERMYKTGDLARWLPDGNIEFLGRIDYQVKIRGYRIELGEIENQLLKDEAVREAVVLDRQDGQGSKYLCAYIVSDREITVRSLRENLSKILPDYMIPTYFMQIDKIPLTLNGKIDRKALPEPDGEINTGIEYIAPRNEVEEKLANIWSEVLEIDSIGIDDDFFILGGHSLKAIKIVSIIQKELLAEIFVGDIFSNPTVRKLGEYLGRAKGSAYTAIEAVEESGLYEASSAQKRMYALNQLSKEQTSYNISYILVLEGRLDRSKAEESFKKLVRRHEAFRTSFELAQNEIMQRIHKDVEFKVEYDEIGTDSEEAIKSEAEKFIKPFDLSQAPLLRVKLIRLAEEKHALMLDMHHIISDGASVSIILEEFAKLYKGEEPEALRVQYKDYSAWEKRLLASEDMKKQEEYWTSIFSDELPILNLPTDYPRPSIQSFEGESIGFKADKSLTDKLKEISRAKAATLYMTLLSAYNVLLSKYSGQEDIIVGSAAAGRPHDELHNMVGMFVNTLAMRNYPNGKKKFADFLQEVKKNALSAYENQDYQFEMLVEKLGIKRDMSRNALFDAMFVLQNTDAKKIELDDISIRGYEFRGKVSQFDMTLEAEEQGDEISFNLQYCTKLFKRETIESLIEHYINILKEAADDPDIQLCEIDMLTKQEKEKVLFDFNDTNAEYPKGKTIHQLFAEQVERTPDNIAAVYKNQKLTYRELNEKANCLARRLREKGAASEAIVGIMAEGSAEMIIGILGILKAGAAYLPIDPKYPKDRIDYMLMDSKTTILLSDFQPEEKLSSDTELMLLKEEELYKGDGSSVEMSNTPSALAYVIYTSGSTGKPKGVMIEHGSLVNMCKWNTEYYGLTGQDSVTKYAGFGFDASVWEIFPALITGAAIHIIAEDIKLDLDKLNQYYNENNITISFLPTQIAEQFMKLDNKSLRYLQAAGDKLRYFEKKSYTVVNNYGPTENTVVATSFVIDKAYDNIPIGRPTANTQAYILDKYNKPQPIGVPGELCLGGEGLARGYLNNAELTAEKFTANPFIKGGRLYKTGDLARWLPEGNIEFLGRIDQQVKIRGFRIELGEIENCILKLAGVKEAVVIDRGEAGNKYLCAYLVSETEYSAHRLREELKKSLPDYMIPAYFAALKEIPLNQNGKIDRKALPMPDAIMEAAAEYVAAASETEEKLISIWSEVLGIEKIGAKDNFFELGGHSLKAIKLVSIIQKELMVEISVGYIFSNPTVRELAEYIGRTKESAYSSIEAVEESEVYQVSSVQKRMFALNQFSKEETNYNIPSVMLLEGRLVRSKLEECFKKLVERHEAFRTSFELVNDEIMQRIHKAVEFKVEYEEIDTDSEELIKSEAKKFIKPFNLGEAPLLRVKLIRLAEEKHVLMFDMHHIISDGTSMSIIMDEFTKLYKGESLEELRVQYKDYSAWENKMLASESMKKHEEYWVKMFSDEIPVLNLPTDYQRPSTQSFEGENIGFRLDKNLTEKLQEISKAKGATLYMTLLAAYNILLSKYSGQEDIVVGSPIAGRPHVDLYNMLGMFVNTLALRNYPERKKTFNEFLQEVKKNALSAYEHQDYQFDKLVEKLNIKRDLSRNALFDTMFTLQNTENKELQLDAVRIRQLEFERGVSKFDITLSAEEKGEEIRLDLEYCTKLFKRPTMKRMIGHYINILKAVTEAPDIKLCEIEMLSEAEKQEILVDFNDTKAEYPKDKTICEYFEEQVKNTPDNAAAAYEGKKITYKELNAKANQLARVLRDKGVKPDTIVGLLVDRSLEMMIGIVGILKAGGAYLPISPDYPDDRIKYMLEDSGTDILLTQKHLLDAIEFQGTVIDLEDEQLYQGDETNPEIVSKPNNLAYIIYTSGSTGKPKGVMIQHGNVINLVEALGKAIYERYTAPLNVTMLAPYVFDASVKQIFASLLRGSCLYIVPEEYRNIGEKLTEYYIENSIDISDGTPSHFKLMLGDNKERIKDIPVKHFVIGGEALPVDVVKEFLSLFKDKKPNITNIYGPTECTVDTTAFLVDSEQLDVLSAIPIGWPLMNCSVYVLDKDNKLQPVGVAGELCIAGAGVARGYLNKPELTEEKFAANPFEPGKKMYRTGDLARWLPDGNIEFLGRIDHQVKLRGYRIEIGEIESLIKSHPTVKDSIVIVHGDNTGEKGLAAYIVPKTDSDEKYSEASLKEYLKKQLPKYMVPAVFVQLESMPLNTNGKIDRFALPKPDMQRDLDESFIAPRNKEEIEMAKIWAKTLGTPKIGIDDDFFDLGGDSFKAIKLVRSISSSLGVMELFKNPTIRELTAYLSKDVSGERTMLNELTKPVDEKDRVVSLICFPYGGGSAISYQPLANALPKNYSLYSVELPGHDYSCPDEELAAIEDSAARCLEEIKEKVKGPIVLYGHCLGATMAAFLAYELEAAGIQVDGVFVGAMFPSPRISNKFFDIWNRIFPYKLTDKGNRDMMRTIGGLNKDIDPKETEFILRNLKHDSVECEKWYTQIYNDKEKGKFKAPITCVIGEGDRVTEFYQERYKEWEHFSDDVDLKTIKNAGHFFFKNQAAELAEYIKEKVGLWQGRAQEVPQAERTDECIGSTSALKKQGKKQVVPSMQLFLIVAIVQIISEVGTILSTFGTGIWVYQQTNALSQFAMMLLFGIVPTIIILPISGAIIDRLDRRLIILAADILSAVSSLYLLMLLYNNSLQIWEVYLFTVIASVATSFRQPAYLAAITQITPKMYLAQANSVSQFSAAIGGILASVCGGIFMDYIGFKGLVAIDFATFIISIAALIFIRFPDTMFTRQEEPIMKELLGGLNFIIKRQSMVVMVAFFLVANFLGSIFDVTMTPLILSFTNPSMLGFINAFTGIGVLTGAIAMLVTGGTKKRAKGMVGFVIPLAISMFVAGLRPLPVFAAIALFGVAFSITAVNVHWQSLIQVKVGLELQGRVFAINRMMVAMLTPISYLTAGVLADKVFAPMMSTNVFSSPLVSLILGTGAGREMRLNLLIAGTILLAWSVIGVRYKPLSEMDDLLEDATPGEVIIKDKDKLQEMLDRKARAKQYTWVDEAAVDKEE
jgi:fengycin family lipopeptide synthetase D